MCSRDNLKSEIESLIRLKQEGSYWDFKREWYSNETEKKRDMLHDIICLANNLENRDAYIIIGIDEETGWSISDVVGNKHRRNTQNLIDFLREKHFAGDCRPVVCVESLSYVEGTIDVIVIENSFNTPFYLVEEEIGVHPNNIYVRYMDSNTPINKSAPLHQIEQLWKKRFRLLDKPIERAKFYLKDEKNWCQVPSDKRNDLFYEFSPEYTIRKKEYDDSSECREFFMFHQANSKTIWGAVKIKYFGTIIEEYTFLALDGGRYFTIMPDKLFLHMQNEDETICCYHFIADSMRFALYDFYNRRQNVYDELLSDQRFAFKLFTECVIVFSSVDESNMFIEFARIHWGEREKYYHGGKLFNQDITYDKNDKEFKEYQRRFDNMQILKNMLNQFRDENVFLRDYTV